MLAALGYDVHVSEIYNPERFKEECERLGLMFGQAFDLQVIKPGGGPWNLSLEADQKLCRETLAATRPLLLIGSPMCRMFSNLMRLNRKHYSDEAWQQMMDDARVHLQFVVSLYVEQQEAGLLWLHEQPDLATSWGEECVCESFSPRRGC